VSFGGAPIKVDASDVSKFEREQRVTSVVIAPAERYVFEVMFDRSGTVQFMNVDTAYYAPIEWGRRHAGHELPVDEQAGPVDPARRSDRQGKHGHRLARAARVGRQPAPLPG
jgi:hypothetical protein